MDPTLDSIVSTKKPLWQRITSGITSLALLGITGYGSMACDKHNGGQDDAGVDACGLYCDSGSDVQNNQSPLSGISSGSLSPSNGSTVQYTDSPLPVGMKVPTANPTYTGTPANGADVSVSAAGDNGTPSNTADDWSKTVVTKTGASLDSIVSGSLDLLTANNGAELKDGEKVTFTYTATPKGSDTTTPVTATSTVTYKADTNPVKVTGCDVVNSRVGGALRINCTGQSTAGPITGYSLTGGPSGAIITSTGAIGTGRLMEASDVGLHTYDVTCSDGTNTSPHYIYTVPVDEHASYTVLHCQGGTDENLLLPETSVDTVATTCGTGFNPALKPATGSDPDYILDVTPSCVQGAINGLTAAEKEAHKHYNQGKTVADVYATCTVDFAQVKYIK